MRCLLNEGIRTEPNECAVPGLPLPASELLFTMELFMFWGSVSYACWYKLFFLWSCHPGANTFSCLQWNVLCVHLHFLSVSSISLRAVHTVWSRPVLQHSAAGGHWQGLLARSLFAVRKLTLIGLVAIRFPPKAPCHRGTCQSELL